MRNMKYFITIQCLCWFITKVTQAGPLEDMINSTIYNPNGGNTYTLTSNYFADSDLGTLRVPNLTIYGEHYTVDGLHDINQKYNGIIVPLVNTEPRTLRIENLTLQNFTTALYNQKNTFLGGVTFMNNDYVDIYNDGNLSIVGNTPVYINTGITGNGTIDLRGILYVADTATITQSTIASYYPYYMGGKLSVLADALNITDNIRDIFVEWRGGTNNYSKIYDSNIHVVGDTTNNADLTDNILAIKEGSTLTNNIDKTLVFEYLNAIPDSESDFATLTNNGYLYVKSNASTYDSYNLNFQYSNNVKINGTGILYISAPTSTQFFTLNQPITQNKVVLFDNGNLKDATIYGNVEIQSGTISGNSNINGNLTINTGTGLINGLTSINGDTTIDSELVMQSYSGNSTISGTVINNGILSLIGNITLQDVHNLGVLNGTGILSFNNITNSGTLNINGIVNQIFGDANSVATNIINISGDTAVNQAVENQTISVNYGTLTLLNGLTNSNLQIGNYGSLSVDANKMHLLHQELVNNGTLILTNGTNIYEITGAGKTRIDGTVETNQTINQGIDILSQSTLTSQSNFLNGTVLNHGILNLDGGILTTDVYSAYINGLINVNASVQKTSGIIEGQILNLFADLTITDSLILNDHVLTNENTNTTINGGFGRNTSFEISENSTINVSNANFDDSSVIFNIDGYNYGASGQNIFTINGNATILDSCITGNIYVNDTGNTTLINNDIHGNINIESGGVLNTDTISINNLSLFENNGVVNLGSGVLNTDISGIGVVNIHSDNILNLDTNHITITSANIDGRLQLRLTDIHPNSSSYAGGHLNINGDLTLGTNAILEISLDTSNLNVQEQTAELDIISVFGINNDRFSEILINDRYYAERTTSGKYTIKYVGTPTEIIEYAKGTENDKIVAEFWDRIDTYNQTTQLIQSMLQNLSKQDASTYLNTVKKLKVPDTNIAGITQRTNINMINNQIINRLLTRISHDEINSSARKNKIWGQMLYNTSNQNHGSKTDSLNSDTVGTTFGMDTNLSKTFVLGAAYTLNLSDVKTSGHTINTTGHTLSLYSEIYRPKWYLDSILGYSLYEYEDATSLAGIDIKSRHKTHSFNLNIENGYNMGSNVYFVTDVRYLNIKQNSYTDSIGQTIHLKNWDTLTFGLGSKYFGGSLSNKYILSPVIGFILTYDILNNPSSITANVNGFDYHITGAPIKPFGCELNIGLNTITNRLTGYIGYSLEKREKFTSHTGKINISYRF